MRKDRAIKAVERMEALGAVDYLGEYYDREAFINRFEQLDESEINFSRLDRDVYPGGYFSCHQPESG